MNASQCLNPDCLRLNLITSIYCDRCRSKLKLGDRYLATHILGEGGFGRTFAALDQHRLNTPCVIKQTKFFRVGWVEATKPNKALPQF